MSWLSRARRWVGSRPLKLLILSASDVPSEDISQLVGHVSTSVTEAVYRHGIRPALTEGATAMGQDPQAQRLRRAPRGHNRIGRGQYGESAHEHRRQSCQPWAGALESEYEAAP